MDKKYYIYYPFLNDSESKKNWASGFINYMNAIYDILKKCKLNVQKTDNLKHINCDDICLVWGPFLRECNRKLNCNNIIFFNSESLVHGKMTSLKYKINKSKIKMWMDYQHSNINYLKKNSSESSNVSFEMVPFIWHPINNNLIPQQNLNNIEKDIDILFYGALNDRRNKMISMIKHKGCINYCYNNNLVEKELVSYILRSKIVLVVFYYPNNKCIDFYRIAPIVYLKTHIVNEDISELEREGWIESGQEDIFKYITFCKYDNIVDKCCELLKDPEKLIELGELCYEHKKENYSLSKMFPVDKLKKIG